MLALLPIAACLVLAAAPDETPSALEHNPAGWTDLLAEAGPSLKGWTRVPIPPNGTLKEPSPWSLDAASGVLTCAGDKSGHEWLRWDREQNDGILHVEWRFVPVAGKKGYNSGVFLRNSADGRIWYQAQAGSASGGFLFGDMPDGEGVKRFQVPLPEQDKRVKPAGEWNTFELTVRGHDLSLWVNGAETGVWHHCDPTHGFAGLEAEGWRIEFRNVKLKPQ